MFRLFVAIAIPAALRQRLALLQGGVPGARWTNLADFHLTLRFIGEVDALEAEEIEIGRASCRERVCHNV